MDYKLWQDIDHFFRVYDVNTEKLFAPLPKTVRDELDEELRALKDSVRTRLEEESLR